MPSTRPPEGWKWTQLTDVARLETGHTPSRNFPEYWDGDVPWVGIRDATGNHGQTIHETNQYTTDLGIENSSARILPANTVCLSRTASVGYVIVMGRPMATSQDFVNWVCSDALDYRFLKYVLLAEKRSFLRFAHGTTHQTIYFPEVKAFHICLPPIEEQRAIASILGALDDKIELNRRMNATLESLARAIFKSWFVDFDPVHHNAVKDNAGKMPASSQALATHVPKVLDLFPSTFQDSELGPIPAGWRIETLGDHVELQRGKTYKSKLKGTPGPYLLGLGTIERNGGFRSNKLVTYGGDNPENLLVYPGDLYVSLKDVTQSADLLGSVARVPTSIKVGRMTQDTVKLVFNEDAPSRNIVYRTLLTPAYRDYCRSHATGTTNLGLAREDFLSYPLIVPPPEIENVYDEAMRKIEGKIDTNDREATCLGKSRDTLLPQLLSGDVSIPIFEEVLA